MIATRLKFRRLIEGIQPIHALNLASHSLSMDNPSRTDVEPAAFTPAYLSTLRFPQAVAAQSHLQSLAIQNGFKVSSRDALTADYIRFYCHRGKHSKGEHQSTKTDCPFQLNLRRETAIRGPYHVMPSSVLEHNHDLLPAGAPPLSEAIRSTAKAMLEIGIERRAVIATVYQLIGHPPTPEQLASIMDTDQMTHLVSETEALIHYMTENGGDWFAFEIPTGERAAILTITPPETANLRQFGDVIFLDGTMMRNPLGWTTIPITLINECYQIVSGGLLFTAYETEEVFDWFLAKLWDFLHHAIHTILTDEDSALVSSMAKFHFNHPEVAHRLCVFHKRRNFQKRLDIVTKDSKVQAEALRLFQIVLYSRRQTRVDQYVRQLNQLLPTLADYIEKEINQCLCFCSEAYRGGALTLGINHTGVAESTNKMLKSSPVESGFVGIREAHSRNHEIKAAAAQVRISRQFQREHFLHRDFGLELSRPLQKRIDDCVSRSRKWDIHRAPEDATIYLARHQNSDSVWHLRYDETNPPDCECNETSGTGLPCPHVIALFHQMASDHDFPVQAIAPRWYQRSPHVDLPPLPILRLHEVDAIEKIVNALSSDDENRVQSDDDNDDPVPPSVTDDSARDKYLRMFHVAKEVTRKASTNPTRYDDVLATLSTLLQSLTVEVDGEVRDAAGRPKGRPRRRGYSQPEREGAKHCCLCDSDGHNIRDCRHYPTFCQERAVFVPEIGGKRRCSLCQHSGHRCDTCPVLDIARRRVRDEPRNPGHE
jgi:hypothetical protein